MLLSIFETIAGRGQPSLTAWANHINGAAALLRLRGPERLTTQLGLRLFTQITFNLMTSFLVHGIPLPDHIIELKAEAAKHVHRDHVAWRVFESMMAFTDFRYRVKHGAITKPGIILDEALRLDRILAWTFSGLEPYWQYETVYRDADSDIVSPTYYHVYRDIMSAQL